MRAEFWFWDFRCTFCVLKVKHDIFEYIMSTYTIKMVCILEHLINSCQNFILKNQKNSLVSHEHKFCFLPYKKKFKHGFWHFHSLWSKFTYRFFLFFHSTGHLWNGSIYRRILMQVWQFFWEINRHWLRGIELSRPKWKFSRHFFSLSPRFLLIRIFFLNLLFLI